MTIWATEIDEDGAAIGEFDDTPTGFGRIAASTARQIILQRLRDAEDDNVLGEFRGQEGELVSGPIQQGHNPHMVQVNLGTVEALLPPPEQVPGEKYMHGNRLRAYVVDVHRGTKGPSITLSRSHPGLVRKLFELEVPEIADNVRGDRGAGPRGRPPLQDRGPGQCPGRERQGCLHRRDGFARARRHDGAERREDRHRGLQRRPGDVHRQRPVPGAGELGDDIDAATRSARVVVPDFQLSLAIGKEGQNARLAAKLTGWRIDIVSDARMQQQAMQQQSGQQ